MSIEGIFEVGSTAVLAGWLCLVFLPFWRGTQVIAAVLIPFLLGLAYTALIASSIANPSGEPFSFESFGSIEGIRALFEADAALVAGWFHYLAFDLFVGAWIVRDSRRHGIAHWWALPCLPFAFMFGPMGLVLYLLIRTIRLKTVEISA
ncbi:MAG: ABA4-like family protein [Pseudomonadota bacterium]